MGHVNGIAQDLVKGVDDDAENGLILGGTCHDYTMTTANEIPDIQLGNTVTPSPTNELGVKGIGEAGTIASSVAVINAICDALAPLGIKHVDMPASPDRLWAQIQEARATHGNGSGMAYHGASEQAVPARGGTDHSPMPGSLTDEGTSPHAGLADPDGPGNNEEERA